MLEKKIINQDNFTKLEKVTKCPCCLSDENTELLKLDNDKKIKQFKEYSRIYYSDLLNDLDKNMIVLSRCLNCDHLYYKYQPSDEFLSKMYQIREYKKKENINKNINASKKKNKKFSKILKKISSINNGKKLFDFGAGDGSLQSKCEDFDIDYYGFEPIESRNNKIDNKKNFSDFQVVKSKNLKFDIVVINQVLEHLKDPLNIMNNIHSICHNKTIIYISVPNINRCKEKSRLLNSWPYDEEFGHHTLAPFQHLQGFNTKSLILLMRNSNFEVSKSIKTLLHANIDIFRILIGLFFKKISTTDILFVKKRL